MLYRLRQQRNELLTAVHSMNLRVPWPLLGVAMLVPAISRMPTQIRGMAPF